MSLRVFLAIFLLALTASLLGCSESQSPRNLSTPTAEERLTLVLGDISDDPSEVIEGAQPLADYLAAHLSDFGFTDGEVLVVQNADQMAEKLRSGEVDLYFDSVYPATLISDATGAQVILRRWRYGVAEYFTVIFTHANTEISSLKDLLGQMIVFDNPFSTSGFLLPAVAITEEGYTLVGKTSYTQPVAPDEIGFVFSYDDENTFQWILSDYVAAGATDDYHFYQAFPKEITSSLFVLRETNPVPRQVVVAKPGLSEDLRQAIIEILINADQDPAAQQALEHFQTTKFDQFPEGILDAQIKMREMISIIQEIPLP